MFYNKTHKNIQTLYLEEQLIILKLTIIIQFNKSVIKLLNNTNILKHSV